MIRFGMPMSDYFMEMQLLKHYFTLHFLIKSNSGLNYRSVSNGNKI